MALSQIDARGTSLFGEIFDWLLAPLLLLWPLSVGVSYYIVKNIADTPFDETMNEKIAWVAKNVGSKKGQLIFKGIPQQQFLLNDSSNTFFAIFNRDRQFVAGQKNLALPPLNRFDQLSYRVQFDNAHYRGLPIRRAYTKINVDIDLQPSIAYVVLAESTDRRQILTGDIIKGIILPQLLILPILLLFAAYALSRGLTPLRTIQKIISDRPPQNLAIIPTDIVPEEIQPVIRSMNQLLEHLEKALTTQKNFIANAAHQMKTPLAGLRAQVELARHFPPGKDLDRSLEFIAHAIEHSTRLINQLLLLARSENLHETERITFSVSEICRQAVNTWIEKALEKKIDLGFESTIDNVNFRGLPLMLFEAISNLIDNAIRYNPPGSIVTLRLEQTPAHIKIRVEDNGVGFTQEQQSHLFERFYRVAQSTEGSGLGLSIVYEIVRFHGGTVEIDSPPKHSLSADSFPTKSPPQGTCFTLSFPLDLPATDPVDFS